MKAPLHSIAAALPCLRWPSFLVLIPAIFFGLWFKRNQLILLTPKLLPLYPLTGWLDSVFSSCLIFLIACALDRVWLKLLSDPERLSKYSLLNSLTYYLFLGMAFSIPLRSLFLVFVSLKLCLVATLIWRGGYYLRPAFKLHLRAFLIVLLSHYIFNSFLTPRRWDNPIAALDLYESAVVSLNGATSRGTYINAKQFDFSGLDDSNWGMAAPALGGRSQVIGLVTFLLDLPSMDVTTLLRLSMIVGFVSCVLAGFGFFCLCLHSLQLLPSVSLIGGCLYVLGNFFMAESITQYFPYFYSVYMTLPFGLLALERGIQGKNPWLMFLSGILFSLHLYIFQSHPEAIINGTVFFSLFLSFLLLRKRSDWRVLAPISLLSFIGLGLSAFWLYAPFLQSIYQDDIQVLGHQNDLLCIWGLKLSKSVISMLVIGIFPFVAIGGLARTEKGTSLFKDLRFSLFLVFALVLGLVTLPGRDSPFILLAEHLKIFKSFNLWVPARLWTYLFLPLLISGLVSLDFFLKGKEKWRRFTLFIVLMFVGIVAWRIRGYWEFHREETVLSTVWLVFMAHFLKREQTTLNARKLPYALALLITYALILQAATLGWPNMEEQQNKKGCLSYLSTEALLTKYEALEFDAAANNRTLKAHLSAFEKALQKSGSHFMRRPEFSSLLSEYGVSGVTQLSGNRLYSFSKAASGIIDDFYFGGHGGCLYNTELPHGWGTGVWHNLAALFRPISKKHYRSLDSTGQTHHFGIGEGLIINDATVGFDGAYMRGYPPLYALYVSPGNYHDSLDDFSPKRATTMYFGVKDTLLNPLNRKVLGIAGIDTYTIRSADYDKIKHLADIEVLASNPRLIGGEQFSLVRDKSSYGVAYLANEIHYVDPSINHLEKYPFPLFRKAPHLIPEYRKEIDFLFSKLQLLKRPHSIYLEDGKKAGSVAVAPIGNKMEFIGMHGAKAAFQVKCQAAPCWFVFNFANIQGWNAYSDKEQIPIKRANFAFMGMEVPKGDHLVWLEHERFLTLIGRYFSWIGGLLFFSFLPLRPLVNIPKRDGGLSA